MDLFAAVKVVLENASVIDSESVSFRALHPEMG